MTPTDIKRLTITMPAVDDYLPSVQKEAAELLGYDVPDRPEYIGNGLLDTLRRLEIEVLDWHDVLRYQTEMRHKAELEAVRQELSQDAPPRWHSYPDWRETEIAKYKGFIPAHALQKAVEIKRLYPEAEFFVEALEHSPDPFLVVKVKKNSYDYWKYYIEVWDEPDFEARI